MRVGIGSIFRNSTPYINRYVAQVNVLARLLHRDGNEVEALWVEANSTDYTLKQLQVSALRLNSFQCDHHTIIKRDTDDGIDYGHVDDAKRWAQIAHVANGVLEAAAGKPGYEELDALVYVESDLIWKPSVIYDLIQSLEIVPAIAPMCFWLFNGQFYDTWGHRKYGERFKAAPPYHHAIPPQGLTPIDSAGSCIVMRREVFSQCRFQPEDGIVGLCRDIKAKGFQLWLDTSLAVTHPAEHNT